LSDLIKYIDIEDWLVYTSSKMKIHTFVMVTQGDGKPGNLTFKNLFSTRSETHADEITKFLLEENAGFRRASQARNTREIVVIHVSKAEHERWVKEPGRNGLVSKPVQNGQVFPSATAASGHIGLRHNEVAMALSRCVAAGEKTATVRGVTFAYKD
jgi:hypothetical protein